jgi:4-alpha-glucanotransferase
VRLEGLAALHGVSRTYRTDRGERVTVSRDTLVGVLHALGVDTDGRGWITRAAEHRRAALADQLVEPVIVAWDGVLDIAVADTVTDVQLQLEDGGEQALRLHAPTGRVDAVDIVPPGYHRLLVSAGARVASATVISAPGRVWRPEAARTTRRPTRRARHFGVYAPLFALHRHDLAPPGDFHDLATLLDWVGAHGGDTVLTLPLLASFLDEPQEVSPYSPVSRLMWNELYVSLDGHRSGETDPARIDYVAAARDTETAIRAAIPGIDADPFASADLMRHLAARPEVGPYSRFRAAQSVLGRNWRVWPVAMRDGDLDGPDVDPRHVPLEVARYHAIAQWLADTQLGEVGRRARAHDRLLGLDLAIGTHPDGYDVWRHRDTFATRANVGAPPDTFFVAGQDWGFPPLLPDAARRSGHTYFRQALAHHLRHATLLRIDHVMGLHRLYWVPHGAAATAGTYVAYPSDELFAIVCLESIRAEAVVVGEDLGTVPPAVRSAMRRHALTGTWVTQGALDDLPRKGTYAAPPRAVVASLNTHDMPTFAGFVAGADIDDRLALGQIDDETAVAQHAERAAVVAAAESAFATSGAAGLRDHLVGDLGQSPASVALVNLEDVWLETRPHNVPGTSTERPNWRRPAAHPVDQLDDVPGAAAVLTRLDLARS